MQLFGPEILHFAFSFIAFFFLSITFPCIWPERRNLSYAFIISRSGEQDPSSEIASVVNQWGQHNCDIIRSGPGCSLPAAEPCAAVAHLWPRQQNQSNSRVHQSLSGKSLCKQAWVYANTRLSPLQLVLGGWGGWRLVSASWRVGRVCWSWQRLFVFC